jgi:hypothetical protein
VARAGRRDEREADADRFDLLELSGSEPDAGEDRAPGEPDAREEPAPTVSSNRLDLRI